MNRRQQKQMHQRNTQARPELRGVVLVALAAGRISRREAVDILDGSQAVPSWLEERRRGA